MWEMLVVGGEVVHFYKLILIWFLPQLNVWVCVMIPRSHTAAIGSGHFSVQCWRNRIMSSGFFFTVAIFTGESSELVIFEMVSLIAPKVAACLFSNLGIETWTCTITWWLNICVGDLLRQPYFETDVCWLSFCPEVKPFHTVKISIHFNNGKWLIIYYMSSARWLFRSVCLQTEDTSLHVTMSLFQATLLLQSYSPF